MPEVIPERISDERLAELRRRVTLSQRGDAFTIDFSIGAASGREEFCMAVELQQLRESVRVLRKALVKIRDGRTLDRDNWRAQVADAALRQTRGTGMTHCTKCGKPWFGHTSQCDFNQ